MKIRSASTPHHVGGDSVEDFGSKQSVSNIFSSTLLNCWTVVSWKRHVWLCFQAKSICWLLISNTEAAEMTNRVICVENRTSVCLLSLWPLHFLLLSLVFAQAGDNAIFPPPHHPRRRHRFAKWSLQQLFPLLTASFAPPCLPPPSLLFAPYASQQLCGARGHMGERNTTAPTGLSADTAECGWRRR